jgi:putative nucleotidyltransferase with HDIG domain
MDALLKANPTEASTAGSPPSAALTVLSANLEASIPGIESHSRRVARYAAAAARELDLPYREVERVRRAAAIHDIGKVEMPPGLVNKPGAFSREEFVIVKRHAQAGARIAKRCGQADLAAIIRHHHERFDGDGYPDGLAGERIPLGARIVAVADTFDAATSSRPYREAMAEDEALSLLWSEAGRQFDPKVVAAFCAYYSGPRELVAAGVGAVAFSADCQRGCEVVGARLDGLGHGDQLSVGVRGKSALDALTSWRFRKKSVFNPRRLGAGSRGSSGPR